MAQKIEDLKETAPCGIIIHYTVDESDFVIYNDINDRGKDNKTEKCNVCSWSTICKPTYPEPVVTEVDYLEIISKALGKEVDPIKVILQLLDKQKG